MTEQVSVTTERVDDILLLLAHSDMMSVPELLDEYFKPHGNWEGMSLGWTTANWPISVFLTKRYYSLPAKAYGGRLKPHHFQRTEIDHFFLYLAKPPVESISIDCGIFSSEKHLQAFRLAV